ncbi:elongation factor G [Clostridium hydrogenum]|uniref:elongation factor G n=1 Tax=Clostridium hydrogenum TaxID=2855764 RepID=UPI001F3F2B07|nr:TetM/TetW/TetO/TetS family tetracycline resistance ribosomal protection protein [Clostridium hydrogenum]
MNKTIGILAHVDAGKTTFAEQILYHTKSIKSRGRVDHKNSFLDSHEIEKERGITVFSDQAIFNYKDSTYYLVDTPGHADFSSEMERAVQVMDYAIIIISAVRGIQGQTEIVWQILKKHNIPVFFFINKVDRVGADSEAVIEGIKENLTKDVFFIKEEMSEETIEFIAEHDEKLLEAYLEEGYDKDLWLNSMKKMIKENKIFPCMMGSALEDEGIEEFLQKLDELTFTEYNASKNFGGIVYKIRYDEGRNRVTYIKALSGSLKVKDELNINGKLEKVNQIRSYNGNKFITKDRAVAGEIFAVTGVSSAVVGDGVGEIHEKLSYDLVPTLKSKVLFDEKLNPKEVLNYFRILEAEDPALNVIWNDKLHSIEIHIMGQIELEVLKEVVLERFKLNVDFGTCEILYKETILETAIGYGHFEPLRHYAEVHLKIEPGERNSGISFSSQCSTDDLTINYQNLIKTHIFEKSHKGILTGSEVTDLKITLLIGRAHIKHTSGGDFREATYRALRQGLESTKNILLEPYYRFKIDVNVDYMGRVLADIQKLNGSFDTPKISENKVVIFGRGPVATFMNYAMDITELTNGRGRISFVFDGYDACHNEEEVIKRIGYNKNADIEYTSTSVFCSKGQSYLVSGEEAVKYMHCQII